MIQLLVFGSWFLGLQNFECRPGPALMMRRSRQCVQQERPQLRVTGRRHYLFQKIFVTLEKLEAVPAGRFDLVKISGNFSRRRKILRQGPLEWVIPKISRNTAKRLFDDSGAAEDLLAAGKQGPGMRFPRRLIEQVCRDRMDQLVRIAMKLSKLPVETLDEFVH